ncbi:MAG: hypothetical protein KC441_04060 [Anaerolineales bacterium]|nr:hypothetical protein [Anaerolineales bacterium]
MTISPGRVVGLAGALLLVVLVAGGVLISAGMFDLPLNGMSWRERPLPAQTIPAGNYSLTWIDESLPDTNYTLRLTAVHQSGEPDVGYGLIVGDKARSMDVLVSPLGYVTVRVGETAVVPWQPWPHVRTGAEANEIWLNMGGVEGNGRASVRINRELLWVGEVGALAGQVGLLGESYGGGETAVVGWERLAIRD